MSLNFTVDVDVTKQKQRLQCADRSCCQSCLMKWSGGSSLCEHFGLISTEEEVSRDNIPENAVQELPHTDK